MENKAYTYIIANKNNSTIYIGVTSNLTKRIWEHKNKVVEGFSKKYNLNKLVYYEILDDIENAINREKFLKGLIYMKQYYEILRFTQDDRLGHSEQSEESEKITRKENKHD